MIDTSLRVALYDEESGLAGITVAQLNTLIGGSNPDMINTAQRIALYPPRSGLPGATLQAVIDQAGGSAGSGPIGIRGGIDNHEDLATTNPTGNIPVLKGSNREWWFFVYTRDTVASVTPDITNVIFNGVTFDNTFRAGQADNANNQRIVAWRIPETAVTPGTIPDYGDIAYTVTMSGADANSQTITAAVQIDVPDGNTLTSALEFNGAGGPFTWPVGTIQEDGQAIVFNGAVGAAAPVLTSPTGAATYRKFEGTSESLDMHLDTWLLPNDSSQGNLSGSNFRFVAMVFINPS